MITPISSANTNSQMFRGTIVKSERVNEAVEKFTRMERNRWEDILEIASKTNDGKEFSFVEKINKIGSTIIKSLIINEKNEGDLKEEVFFIRKNGTLVMHDREGIVRTVLETLESFYKK